LLNYFLKVNELIKLFNRIVLVNLRPFSVLLSFVLIVNTTCSSPADKTPGTLQILFVGDILLDRGVRERIEHIGAGALIHASIDRVFEKADIIIANLECPATTIEEPLNKKYVFRAEPEWLNALKDRGITHLNLANNHSMDQGRKGLDDTRENILKYGLIPLGFGRSIKQACEAKLIATKPRKVYLFSSVQVHSENWTYLDNKPCVCEKSINSIIEQIIKLREQEPGAVILVQLHWGMEHETVPHSMQKQEAWSLIEAGADAIIGHHTHTIQSSELYKGKPIYYSIGNFIFDQSKPQNSEGLIVRIEISESAVQSCTMHFSIVKCIPQFRN
jgi:poly-gamma-glutamate capsule biosynthesis protein CapA/YwtB (metallophosphatase superfamily)